MESRKAIQGTADGLCGFYALVNFLLLKERFEEEEGRSERHEAFRYLAEAAQRLDLLSPIKLVSGYEWHELIEIFNLDACRRHTSYRAFPIHHLPRSSGKKVVTEVINQGGAAVLLIQDGGHWVLVHGIAEDRLRVADPSYKDAVTSLARVDNLAVGLVILPLSSVLSKALNAQTH